MAGAVVKVRAISGGFDHVARGFVDFPAREFPSGGERALNMLDCRISGAADHFEDFTEAIGKLGSGKSRPTDFVVDSAGDVLLGQMSRRTKSPRRMGE
jgi:hypothetical protein